MENSTTRFEKEKERYRLRMEYLAQHTVLKNALHITNKILTYTVFLLYPLLLIELYCKYPAYLLRAALVPGLSFFVVTIVRKKINRRRPYEAYGIPSAVYKSTTGNSFPSRHVFSIFVIAITFLFVWPNPFVGGTLLAAGVCLGTLRVVLGVHYASDVVCGAAVGIFFGLIGYGAFALL